MAERRARMIMCGAIESDETGCTLHKVHNPSVTTLLVHQVFPVDLQIKAADLHRALDDPDDKDMVSDNETIFVCPTGKTNIDAYISYLLGEGNPLPVRVGTETKAWAIEGVRRYEAALRASEN